jgi:hypothetical protein
MFYILTKKIGCVPYFFQLIVTEERGDRMFTFDADEMGDIIADKMIRRYPLVKRLRPTKHDWNEILQSKYHTS